MRGKVLGVGSHSIYYVLIPGFREHTSCFCFIIALELGRIYDR